MYNRILVPLDGSLRAEAILPHVEELARLYGAEVILLRVFELLHLMPVDTAGDNSFSGLPALSSAEIQAHLEESRAYLEDVCQRLGCGERISTRYLVAYGPIAATIIRTANEQEVDLVAMASHGSSGITGVYYGSVAAGVLQRVDRPLLIVRAYDV
ncbi:MAG: universal stress protein [Candidatus Promineifilaceae bacterium]